MATPIADLSYRNYEGPLEPPINRWWAIAKMSMRLSAKKKGFWIWASLSSYFYLILLIIFYIADSIAQVAPGQKNPFLQQIIWKDQFINAFSFSQLILFIIALLIAVGAIANDNKANALMVYLSKPCTKVDYLIGKWLGIFVPITLVVAAPAAFFFFYCFMSYRDFGFITQDPKLPFKLLGMILIPGTFHASVALGVSSMFNQGRLAGATYAGIYFISNFFTKAMGFLYLALDQSGGASSGLVKNLYYCSLDGIQIGMAKLILGTDGSPWATFARGPRGGPLAPIPAPSAAIFVTAFFAICAFSVLFAWSRIRAVEVVGK